MWVTEWLSKKNAFDIVSIWGNIGLKWMINIEDIKDQANKLISETELVTDMHLILWALKQILGWIRS